MPRVRSRPAGRAAVAVVVGALALSGCTRDAGDPADPVASEPPAPSPFTSPAPTTAPSPTPTTAPPRPDAGGTPMPSPHETVLRERAITYGDDPAQRLDTYVPTAEVPSPTGDAGRRPAIVLVHGGGWVSGHRGYHHRTAASMASRGWVAVTVGYRLAPGDRHPAAAEDVRAALAHVHADADALGIDPARVVLAGDSAGGHLAALVALSDDRPRVAAWVAWSGIFDLPGLPARLAPEHAQLAGLGTAYLGCDDLDDPACVDPAVDASPVTHVDADDPPGILVHATDELVPIADAEAMVAAATEAGARVELVAVPGREHGAQLIPDAGEAVTTFLADVLELDAISQP